MEMSGQLHVPVTLPQGKGPWYPLDRRLGGPWSQFGCGGKEKEISPPAVNQTMVTQPIA